MAELSIFAIEGIGEIRPGMDVAAAIGDAIDNGPRQLLDGDIVAVTHKIVSKAEGAVREVGASSTSMTTDRTVIGISSNRKPGRSSAGAATWRSRRRITGSCVRMQGSIGRTQGLPARFCFPSTLIDPPTGSDCGSWTASTSRSP